VGDSLGNVVLGYESTLPVTVEEVIYHCKAARRGAPRSFIVADMPFKSYHVNEEGAIENACRFVKEAGANAVKLEGGEDVMGKVAAITRAQVPVLGHIGLTPQTADKLGGFKVQGRDAEAAQRLIKQAQDLERLGCFSIVLECVPDKIAEIITDKLKIPTIGIGAGIHCAGQVLVTHDLLGLFERFKPKFVKQYINLAPQIQKAIEDYKKEVIEGRFPTKEHSFRIKEEELKKLD
jgi:3-methyl-2-oxobutanoate hydroxymethyltransferase